MAKTRMLKNDLRTSEKVASWPVELRYFWVLLWGYVDDHGKGRDNPLLVKADCFPLDPDITHDTVNGWLWDLVAAGVIVRYTVDGHEYFQIVNWKEHQKPPHPTDDVIPSFDAPAAVRRALHEDFMKDAGSPPRNAGAPHEDFTPVFGLGRGWVEGGDANASKEPPLFCSAHPHGTERPCGPCGDARRVYDAWQKTRKPALSVVTLPPRKGEDEMQPCSPGQHKPSADGYCLLCAQKVEEAVAS